MDSTKLVASGTSVSQGEYKKVSEATREGLNDFKVYGVNEWAQVENYPYGFNQTCTLRAMIEETKNGQRLVTQTTKDGRTNKAKYSTYETGRFILVKDGWLYTGEIRNGLIKIYDYRGRGGVVLELPYNEESKKALPGQITSQYDLNQRVQEAYSKAWTDRRKEHAKLFSGKTPEQIKADILNSENWQVGGGGYYFKAGFARNYRGVVMVSFTCEYISNTFHVEDTAKTRLTPRNKAIIAGKARVQLVAWLADLSPDQVKVTPRPDAEYPEVEIKVSEHCTIAQI